MHWYLEALKKYAVFTGRARRKEFWWFHLVTVIITGVLGFIDREEGFMDPGTDRGLLESLFTLAMLVPSASVSIRRLHDTGRNGWWLFISVVPLVGLITFVVFMALDGQKGENDYGPDPKEANDGPQPADLA